MTTDIVLSRKQREFYLSHSYNTIQIIFITSEVDRLIIYNNYTVSQKTCDFVFDDKLN